MCASLGYVIAYVKWNTCSPAVYAVCWILNCLNCQNGARAFAMLEQRRDVIGTNGWGVFAWFLNSYKTIYFRFTCFCGMIWLSNHKIYVLNVLQMNPFVVFAWKLLDTSQTIQSDSVKTAKKYVAFTTTPDRNSIISLILYILLFLQMSSTLITFVRLWKVLVYAELENSILQWIRWKMKNKSNSNAKSQHGHRLIHYKHHCV